MINRKKKCSSILENTGASKRHLDPGSTHANGWVSSLPIGQREGKAPVSEFKEITDAVMGGSSVSTGFTGTGIELSWDQGKVIRFPQVDQLIDFLKKVA